MAKGHMKFEDEAAPGGRVRPGVKIGTVSAVNEEKYICTVSGVNSTYSESVMVMSYGGAYNMPKTGDQVLYAQTETGIWAVIAILPTPVINGESGGGAGSGLTGTGSSKVAGGKLNPSGKLAGATSIRSIKPGSDFKSGSDGKGDINSTDKKILSGNEFLKDIIGVDEKGWAAQQRLPMKEGDQTIFHAPGGAHGSATTSGDVFWIYSDVNQQHFYKDNDLFKQFFRRGWITWPGGKLRVGDYKTKDPSEREEDADLELFATTLNDKKIRWRFQFGKNIDGDGQGKNIQKTECFVGKPQGRQTQEKKIFTKETKETLEFKSELKDKDEKKLATVDFLYTDANKFKVELFKADSSKTKIEIDLSSGNVTLELVKGNLLIKADEGKVNIESGGETNVKAGGVVNIEAGGDINLKPGGSVNIQ